MVDILQNYVILMRMNLKTKTLITVILLFLTLQFPTYAVTIKDKTDTEAGEAIAKKYHDNYNQEREAAKQTFMLIDKNNNRKKRSVRWFRLKTDNDARFMAAFTAPTSISGTTLLTWKKSGGDDDQWLYLPGTDTIRRIASSNKGNYFMGTDFTYEDLNPAQPEEYDYRYERTVDCHGEKKCYVINAYPGTKELHETTSYSKRVIWIRADIFDIAKVKYYGKKNNDLIKTQTVKSYKRIGDENLPRPKQIVMDNKKRDHKTLLLTHDIVIDPDINKELFTKRSVRKGLPINADIF